MAEPNFSPDCSIFLGVRCFGAASFFSVSVGARGEADGEKRHSADNRHREDCLWRRWESDVAK